MGGEHERRAVGHLVDVGDEHDPQIAEPVDDEPVVHDLVVAVHGRLEHPDHPGQGLDRHLDPGAIAAGLREEHSFDGHAPRVSPDPFASDKAL